MKESEVRINVRMTPEMHKKVRNLCTKRRLLMRDIMEEGALMLRVLGYRSMQWRMSEKYKGAKTAKTSIIVDKETRDILWGIGLVNLAVVNDVYCTALYVEAHHA